MTWQRPDTLLELSIEYIAGNINRFKKGDLNDVPGDLLCIILDRVIGKAKLTPQVLELFEDTDHQYVLDRIKAIDIDANRIPPIHKTTHNRWLGDSHRYH